MKLNIREPSRFPARIDHELPAPPAQPFEDGLHRLDERSLDAAFVEVRRQRAADALEHIELAGLGDGEGLGVGLAPGS